MSKSSSSIWRRISTAAAVGLIAGFAASAVRAGDLTIYAAVDADKLKQLGEIFTTSNPGIKINWVRDSTGIIHARLMAGKDNPRADVVFGMAATSMLTMDKLGMFEAYTPKGVDALDPRFRDKQNPNHWVGIWG